ncbi:MAG: hypothetical protein U0X73_16600 [Thermoanaerobaculia bacterium]
MHADDAALARWLAGEGSSAERAAIAARLAAEPELAGRARAFENAWRALELAPAAPPPPGFATRVAAAARARDAREGSGAPAPPPWMRWAAAAALLAGIAAGAGFGALAAPPAGDSSAVGSWNDASLAEEYLDASAAGVEAGDER